MTRDGFSLIAMSLSGKKALEWKIKFIRAFNEMEKGLDNFDAKMTRISNEGNQIKQLGREWSKFGHEINKQKKAHDKSVLELIDKVQLKLGLD
jgi:phage regulator Rha-like protein